MQIETSPRLPPALAGRHPTQNHAVPHPLWLEYGIVFRNCRFFAFPHPSCKYPKKFRPFPCGSERGQSAAQKRANLAPVPLILRKQDATLMDGSSGSVRRAAPAFPVSQWHFRACSPYSCGTAQASHLFSRHEETVSSMIATKAGGFATQNMYHYTQMNFILQYEYPYRYLQEKTYLLSVYPLRY